MDSLFDIQFQVRTFVSENLGPKGTTLWDELVESSLEINGQGCSGILMKEVENYTEELLYKMSEGEMRILWQNTGNGVLAIEQGFDEPDRVEMVHDIALDVNQAIVDGVCEEARRILKERKREKKA
jgi:hypothetical protein